MDNKKKYLLRDDYETIDLGSGYKALYRGELFYMLDEEKTIYDVSEVCRMFMESRLDFNQLHGSFRIILLNEETGECTFFGDNSGLLVFYYRSNKAVFTDCLLELANSEDSIEPNYYGATQYLQYGYTLTFDTLIKGVMQADPERYYTVEDGKIIEHSKELKRIADIERPLSVDKVIERSMKATENKYGSVCTGGTDSRSILAWVYALGGRPEVFITGRSENKDVKIAEQVTSKLGLHLNKIEGDAYEDAWLDKAFIASGGITELNTAYRLLRKACSNRDLGIQYEFGGVAGELYKNEFVSKDWPFYNRAADPEKFARHFFSNVSFSDRGLGKNTAEFTREAMIQKNTVMFRDMVEGNKFPSYNNIGYHVMMRKYVTVTNGFSNYFVSMQPLTDRDVVAGVSRLNAHDLEVQKWHRGQIAASCPEIGDIETSSGYTCSNKRGAIAKEALEQRWVFIKLAFNYVMRKFGFKRHTSTQWDKEYNRSKSTPEYKAAITTLRRLGILSGSVEIEGLPPFIAGRILLLGKLYKNCDNN